MRSRAKARKIKTARQAEEAVLAVRNGRKRRLT